LLIKELKKSAGKKMKCPSSTYFTPALRLYAAVKLLVNTSDGDLEL
jgi:hypothetical protein